MPEPSFSKTLLGTYHYWGDVDSSRYAVGGPQKVTIDDDDEVDMEDQDSDIEPSEPQSVVSVGSIEGKLTTLIFVDHDSRCYIRILGIEKLYFYYQR